MATTYTPLLELPKHDPTDPFDITKINDMADLVDAGMAKAYRGKAVHNLLGNSDFRAAYFIAQAGLNGLHGTTKYVGDRWISWNADATFADEYMTPGSEIDQHFYMTDAEANEEHTAVLYMADGTKKYSVGKPVNGFGAYATVYCGVSDAASKKYYVRIGAGQNVKHAALFPGAYTADTLPEYQPKGYAAELAECLLRYRRVYRAYGTSIGNVSREAIILDPPMRVAPTVEKVNGWEGSTGAGYTIQATGVRYVDIQYTGWGNVTLALCSDE